MRFVLECMERILSVWKCVDSKKTNGGAIGLFEGSINN